MACCAHGIYINLGFSLMYTLNKQFTWATTTIWRAKGEVNVLLAVQADDVTGDVHHLLPDSAHNALCCLALGLCKALAVTKQGSAIGTNHHISHKTSPTGVISSIPSMHHFWILNSCTQHTSCWQDCQNASNVILFSARHDLWVAP